VGKTTLAGQLAERLDLTHIELDSIFWGPDWTERPKEEFRVLLAEKMADERWVIDGNYSFARPLVWPVADTAVWLDYALPVVFWRLFWRTIRRTLGQEELWNGNRERFRNQFLSSDSLFLWSVKSQRKHRSQYPALFASAEYGHLTLFRHRWPGETAQWLGGVGRV
jgi:adenylate kinase family enzyme